MKKQNIRNRVIGSIMLLTFGVLVIGLCGAGQAWAESFTFQKAGTGSGTVTIINQTTSEVWICDVNCSQKTLPYNKDHSLQFAAEPATGALFGGWESNGAPVSEITNVAPGDTITAIFYGSGQTLESTTVECDPCSFPMDKLLNYDTVVYEYTDSSSITITPYGQFSNTLPVAEMGESFYTVPNAPTFVVSFASSGITPSPNTFYYIWGGQDSDCNLKFVLSTLDGTTGTMPTGFVRAKRLRGGLANDGNSDIREFKIVGDWLFYRVGILLYSGNAPNPAPFEVDVSKLIPSGARQIRVRVDGMPGGVGEKYNNRAGFWSFSNLADLGELSVDDDAKYLAFTGNPSYNVQTWLIGFQL